MNITLIVGFVFVCLSLFFFSLARQDYHREKGRETISRTVWLRLAFIFLAVGIALSFLHVFL